MGIIRRTMSICLYSILEQTCIKPRAAITRTIIRPGNRISAMANLLIL